MCPNCGSEEFLTVGKVLHPELSLCANCREWVIPINVARDSTENGS